MDVGDGANVGSGQRGSASCHQTVLSQQVRRGSCYGTKRADTINGRPPGDDEDDGCGGDLRHAGYNGADYLQGDGGKDKLYGGNRSDTLWGGPGPRTHPNDRRDDVVHGAGGDDYLYSGFAKGAWTGSSATMNHALVEAQRAYGFPKTKDIVNCGGVPTIRSTSTEGYSR